MSVSADRVEAWLLVSNDVKVRTRPHVKNDVENKKVSGWLEQADQFTVVQKRHFVGLSNFKDEAGDEGSGNFSWYVGGGKTLGFSKTSTKGSPKWFCTQDSIVIQDHITGEGWETQVWELQSKFVPVAGSYYEEDVT